MEDEEHKAQEDSGEDESLQSSQSHQALGVIGIEHQITLIQNNNLKFRISPVKKRQEFIFLVEKANDASNPQVASSEDAVTGNDVQPNNQASAENSSSRSRGT